MMKIFQKTVFFIIILFSSFCIFAEEKILSDYTEQKIDEFLMTRVLLKDEEHQVAVKKINEIRTETLAKLKEHALDYEQEERILESLYFMDIYEHTLTKDTRADLRVIMKDHMLKNFECIENRDESKISKWLYLTNGDVTSYYMTRSMSATFYYGFKVKKLYENAVKKDPLMSEANISLGNWYFYAPGLLGGSNKKAEQFFKTALQGARIDSEKYVAYEYLSQFYFEMKKYNLHEEYLKKAKSFGIGLKEINLIETCNKNGISLFKYRRNNAGIDEELPESEKDEADKK